MDKPKELGGSERLIGSLKMKGSLIASSWADDNLFFRHQFMDDDLKIHPEWAKYCPVDDPLIESMKCPFGFS